MTAKTAQLSTWTDTFGKEYTDRNTLSPSALDALYRKQFGVTRTQMNTAFLDRLDRSIRILEVGCNTGNQLLLLQKMGFTSLYGIEPQTYAVEAARKRLKGINVVQGSAFDLPFKDGYFDLVYTSGVLIHISPKDIKKALKEIHRCSKKFVWGYEYYAEKYTGVDYRGHKDLMWKTDFAKLYTDTFGDLKLVKKEFVKYEGTENIDAMFLLKKARANAHGK